MKKAFYLALSLFLFVIMESLALAEEQPDSLALSHLHLGEVLTDALRCIKMTPQDLTFRDDYVDVDSFRLELIDKLMRHPLDIVSFNSSLRSDWGKQSPRSYRFYGLEISNLEENHGCGVGMNLDGGGQA